MLKKSFTITNRLVCNLFCVAHETYKRYVVGVWVSCIVTMQTSGVPLCDVNLLHVQRLVGNLQSDQACSGLFFLSSCDLSEVELQCPQYPHAFLMRIRQDSSNPSKVIFTVYNRLGMMVDQFFTNSAESFPETYLHFRHMVIASIMDVVRFERNHPRELPLNLRSQLHVLQLTTLYRERVKEAGYTVHVPDDYSEITVESDVYPKALRIFALQDKVNERTVHFLAMNYRGEKVSDFGIKSGADFDQAYNAFFYGVETALLHSVQTARLEREQTAEDNVAALMRAMQEASVSEQNLEESMMGSLRI